MKPRTRLAFVLLALLGPAVGLVVYESLRTGATWSEVLERLVSSTPSPRTGLEDFADDILPRGARIDFLTPRTIGEAFEKPPRISHLEAVDLDRDGLLDVVACDAENHRVTWLRQDPRDVFEERTCAENLSAPAHVQAADVDQDGDLDLVVAVLGTIFPNNDRIGEVVLLENDGSTMFTPHVVLQRVPRVSDARAADLDGDGDSDLAVAHFGYDDGETRWLENTGDWKFESHVLQTLSGPIHCEIADMDHDGDRDIVTLVSQWWEEIYIFLNDGRGGFSSQLIHGSTNDDFGSSSMLLSDLDQDGDLDIIYSNGDSFDYVPPRPRPWHGVQWLENQGSLRFRSHRVADFAGAFNPRPVDADRDGDLDLFVVSAFNSWDSPQAQSFIWLENDGSMRFRRHDIAATPTHLLALASGDFDGDGRVDLVTGGMHTYPPFDRMSRILSWRNGWGDTDASSTRAAETTDGRQRTQSR